MKRIVYLMATISLLTSCNDVPKQTPLTMTDEIVLTAPDTQSGLTVNEALALRQSCRDYSSEELSLEEVSEVLWAASGINRADGKQTAPSALALYPIQVYAFFAEGAYRYEPAAHTLVKVADGDYRQATAMQDFAYTAPLNLVYMANYAKYTGRGADIPHERRWFLCGQDAAGYAENVNIYCAGHGLKSITRGSAKPAQLLEILHLDSTQYEFVLAQTIGK